MNPILLVVTADDHVNSCVGLCPPNGIERDEGGVYKPSKEQEWLWNCWEDLWTKVEKERKRRKKGRVYWVHAGDGVDDNTHSKHGLVTLNISEIVEAGYQVKKRGLDVADKFFFVRGTPAHTGGQGALEELVARRCGAEKGKRYSRWILRETISGVRVMVRHRPVSRSMRYWTRGGGAIRTAAQIMMEGMELGWQLPDVAYFGHFHYPADSGENQKLRVFFVPCFKLHGTFEHSRGFTAEPVGARVAWCESGRFEPLPKNEWLYYPEEETW